MSQVLDGVMEEILKGCRTKVQREHREELRKLRADSKKLTAALAENKILKNRIKKMEDQVKSEVTKAQKILQTERKAVATVAGKVLRSANVIKLLKDRKVGSVIYDGSTGWKQASHEGTAMKKVRKMVRQRPVNNGNVKKKK